MTGNCSTTVRRHLRHRGGGAEPEALRSDVDAVVEKAREADQPVGPAHVFLQKLHHVGAAGDVFGQRVVAAGLGAQGEGSGEVARPLEVEGVHGSTSPHGTGGARRVLDRRDDVVVGSAAAQVATHPFTDFLRRAGVTLCDTGDAGHDLPGCAIVSRCSVPLTRSTTLRGLGAASEPCAAAGDMAPGMSFPPTTAPPVAAASSSSSRRVTSELVLVRPLEFAELVSGDGPQQSSTRIHIRPTLREPGVYALRANAPGVTVVEARGSSRGENSAGPLRDRCEQLPQGSPPSQARCASFGSLAMI
jgi:hypothetical protein